jgi:hypothetical protein
MPTKACCCDPKGRHVAVACRYYGWHTATYVKDAIGNCAGDPRFVGPDGFTTKNFGYQRLFGLTLTPQFTDELETVIRGPYTWNASIKQFDSTRDVILLSRSGGGSSQYTKDQINLPKGGNSSLLQTRVKASLAMEANVGAGGSGFGGGKGTGIGSILSPQYNPNSVPGGGAGGGVNGAGGHGGITNGGNGFGTGNGLGGSQTAGGCAGGSGAFNGLEYIGGTGAPESGGGGGGRYSGGGGANKAGGGGAASKWPAGVSGFSDIAYSEEGSNKGPGGICDPFVPLQETLYHYGMGGGSNLVPDPPTGVGPASPTNFLGFGLDYNPTKEGTPGVVRAIWIDKYCPCNEDDSKVLPDKMYICLTDAQYAVIENEMNVDDPVFNLVKFDLDGETYIYFGRCVNAYCSDIRLVDGTPTNIQKTIHTNTSVGKGGQGVLLNDCCKVIIGIPICKIQQPNCFDCNGCYNCLPQFLKAKYCCENIEEKPDNYWSVYEGYLWACYKTQFWFPFGVKPEDNFLNIGTEIDWYNPFLYDARRGFEKACLPVYSTEQNPPDLCEIGGGGGGGDCEPYFGFPFNNLPPACTVEIGTLFDGMHPSAIPMKVQISSVCCGKPTPTPIKSAWSETDCSAGCSEFPDPPCACGDKCMTEESFVSTWENWCDSTPIVTGSVGDCQSGLIFKNNSTWQANVIEITNIMNPIVGMEITVPKCSTPVGGSSTFLDVTTIYGLAGFCGRRLIHRPNFGINMATIAAALNNNPFGIVYNPVHPNVYISPRYGAKACIPSTGVVGPPAEDVLINSSTLPNITETPSTRIYRYFFLPRTYVYFINVYNNCSCDGASSQTCNGHSTLPPLCGCVSPWINSYRTGLQTQTCWFGIYNMATMKKPIFAKGDITPQEGTLNLCKFPQSLLSQLDADPLALAGYGILTEFGGDAVGGSKCDEWDTICDTVRPPTKTTLCNEKIIFNIG